MGVSSTQPASLYQRLLTSHLQVAGIGVALLCVCVVMIAYFQHRSSNIADVHLPSAIATAQVVNGIDNSKSQLRSWVLLRQTDYLENRRRTWNEQIEPAMLDLELIANDAGLVTIQSLRNKMALLRESQWWIEDVAATVGNDPARLIYEQDLLPNFERIQSAVSGLAIEGANAGNVSDIQLAAALTHQSLSEVVRQLSEAVRTGGVKELHDFKNGSQEVTRLLGDLISRVRPNSDAGRLLNWIIREYRTYEELANQTIALRQTTEWNRALHLLRVEADPMTDAVKASLVGLQTEHNDLLRREVAKNALLSKVSAFVTMIMTFAMLLIAWAVARAKSKRIVAPIQALAKANDSLALNHDHHAALPLAGPREVAHLTERFNHMGHELTAITKDLRHANKELQSYTHIITHDLKPPLINIKGHAGLIKSQLEKLERTAHDNSKPEKVVRSTVLDAIQSDIPDSVAYIDLSISKMKTLVDGVFDNSTLLFRDLSLEEVDMNLLLSQIVGIFSHRSDGVEIQCNALPSMRTDVFLIEHIFTNLIDNALKYLDSDRPGRIEIGGVLQNGQASFYVADNGIGLRDPAVDVFELFKRAQTDEEGAGIGLALVETMLAKLGGRIGYKPNSPHGTIFEFNVPERGRTETKG